MSDASFVASDTAPSLLGTLTNEDGTPYDLTNATSVRFQMRLASDGRFKVNAVATIVSPTEGTVRYDWAAGDLDTPGDYVSRWRIAFNTGELEHTIPANTITVEQP